MMRFLGSVLFSVVMVLGTIGIAGATALVSPFSHDLVRRGAHLWSAWCIGCARILLGLKLEVRGSVPQEGVIVASKHTSAYETILTLYLFHHPAVVMKSELRKIPIWGFVSFKHGSIFVERGKGASALKSMLRQAKARVAEGRPIFIFPEGTRVKVGTAPPLKPGLFGVYSGLKLPVVPVTHNAGEFWVRGFVKRPGTITITFMPEIPAGLPREELEGRVHAAINRDPLTAEARA
ncbi:lysophospholipid acyltransferase family protein [Sandaracinobacteroides hominis]|uniref:lysophospholipid acyltransferase family protein n=1 Tax=Sandaracinobacteroides hominis TaxID=2780086 RepID=UPI0018F40BCA|nr:lysophospholipid acyltransferase family protein [Sandaracinobacteroides hominis]